MAGHGDLPFASVSLPYDESDGQEYGYSRRKRGGVSVKAASYGLSASSVGVSGTRAVRGWEQEDASAVVQVICIL